LAEDVVDAAPAIDTSTRPVPPYRSPAWLAGGHMQTIWPYLLRRPVVPVRRERVGTPDGDFWDFDWAPPTEVKAGAPLVVLLHGLEGS